MGSKASKAKRPTPVIIPGIPHDTLPIPPRDTVSAPLQDTIPIIPLDIINEILDHLATDFRTLRACALVSRSWIQPCQRLLFHTARFTPTSAFQWLQTFPVRDESPAHHVRDLLLGVGQVDGIPEKFFGCIPWFTAVERLFLTGYGGGLLRYRGPSLGYVWFPPLWEPYFWNIPRSVTSLTIETGAVTLMQVRDIMAQLPNLNDLMLSGFAKEDGRKWPGIGTILKGRFGGRLMVRGASVSEDIINLLLEIPSGLHFVELKIECSQNRLPSSAVRLAEACGKTLVKLSHDVTFYSKSYPFPLVRLVLDTDVASRYR